MNTGMWPKRAAWVINNPLENSYDTKPSSGMSPMIRYLSTGIVTLAASATQVLAWNATNHRAITRAVVETTTPEHRSILSKYENDLIQDYCLIPDTVRSNPKSPFITYVTDFLTTAKFNDIPEKKLHGILHGADRRANNTKVYEFYTTRILDSLLRKETDRAIIYLGTFMHYLEDSHCPAHFRFGIFDQARGEGDGSYLSTLEFFKRFIVFPKSMEKESLHKLVDQCPMEYGHLKDAVVNRSPKLLGKDRKALLAELTTRHEASLAKVDTLVLPLLQAMSMGDTKMTSAVGEKAAALAAALAQDYCYTIFEIARHEAGTQPAK